MGGRVVTVRLNAELLKLIDELVRLGIYDSRSEALRDLIRIGAKHVKQIMQIAETVDKLFEIERKEGSIPIRLEGALKKLLTERERYER